MFMMPLHPPQRPLFETLAENTEKAILADRLGYEELWVGQHFSATSEPIASPLIFLAGLLSQTQQIKLGTGVINLPNFHPAVVAAEVAQFDHMARGRLLFGVGPGGLGSDFELFNNEDGAIRNERMLESLDAILKIWSSDPPYAHAGKHWQFQISRNVMPDLGIGSMPKPYQKPHPPLSVAAMSPASAGISAAAARGWSVISANFITPAHVRSHWLKWVEGCERCGRDPKQRVGGWSVARNIFVADSDAEAEDQMFADGSSHLLYFQHLVTLLTRRGYVSIMKEDPQIPDSAFTPRMALRSMGIWGSVKTVIEKLVAFREQTGPFGTLLTCAVDWSGRNAERERRSMRLLAEKVLPAFAGVDA
jgi:alkanesulfonate monooxygenase SsuD/methylene tetrahydromethanopterin reductase-like flavin-dependent oxidoreductase (luciferase family)